ncbi:MAG TPA: ABC transporter permease [Gemmatimonadaceae bacterium]|jgi:predicted permease|nr:ABC transporter permease [Gemmatimonadaceae bacterium]
MRNLKLALRTLFKTPFVTTVAVLSLALGIGANTGIFSLFDQMLRRPLPVHQPERLVNLSAPGPKYGSQSCNNAGSCEDVFSYAMFRDLERARTPFTGLAAHRAFGANIAYHGQTMNGEGMLVSGSYFPTLGVRPALGRLLTPADDQTVGAHFVAVLSHGYWETRLGGDPGVIDQQIVINGHPMTIIGVAPRDFTGTTLGVRPSVFVPLTMRGLMNPGFDGFENRRSYWAYVFGRLKPGMSKEQAKREVDALYRTILNDVEAPLQEGMSEQVLARFRAKEITLADGQRGQSSLHEESRTPLLLLLGITGIVLLIACANIANLLLARGANRAMEMAVRLSLGATRGQLLRQLLTESLLLALFGGAVSLVVARWTLTGIITLLPPDSATALRFEMNTAAVLFAMAMSIATGLLFGLFPALNSTRPDLVSTLRSGVGKHSGARAATRFRTSLVVAQIALSMALLISAGLFVKSLFNVTRVELGLRPENIVTFAISPELNGYNPERAAALFARVEEEMEALPGVTGVTASLVPLLAGSNWGNDVSVEGFKEDLDTDDNARFSEVGPGYFRVLGIPLLSGREFTIADGAKAAKVAVVNEAFAKKFNLGREAVGKRMSTDDEEGKLDIEIVGLAKDAKYSSVKGEVPPLYFTPYRQDSTLGFINFYVRTAQDPQLVQRSIPSVISRLDPNLPVEGLKTLPQQIRENVFLDRMISTLTGAFALVATILAAVGLYGVLAYTVAQRTKEIGVRMALGADARRVRGMVLKQVGLMTIAGSVVGIAGAFAIGRAASSLLFGMQGHDPWVFTGAALVLALVAFAAGYLPAHRASRVDPMQALRYE